MPDITAANTDIATPELMKSISAAFNSRDVDRIVDCFTDDGVWEVRMRRIPDGGFTCRGRDQITASLEAQTSVRAPALYAKHLLIEPRIVLDGDTASVESYFARIEPRDDGPTQIVASGRYLDGLVRGDDGRWRFTHRIAEIDDM